MKKYAFSIGIVLASYHENAYCDPFAAMEAVRLIILIIFGIWVGGVFLVARALTRLFLVRLLITVIISSLPIAYFWYQHYSYQKRSSELTARYAELRAGSEIYLNKKCETERHSSAPQKVIPMEGVFIDIDPKETLGLLDVPQPEAETPLSLDDHRRYGHGSIAEIHSLQYSEVMDWDGGISTNSLLRSSSFSFVKMKRSTVSPAPLSVSASKAWWESFGLKIAPPVDAAHVSTRIMNEKDTSIFDFPVKQADTRYIFAVRDISTVEDRRNWVARLRLQLTDTSTGKLVAEYLGFAANRYPGLRSGNRRHWEMVKPCSGVEERYAEERGHWNLTDFFFKEVVQYADKPLP